MSKYVFLDLNLGNTSYNLFALFSTMLWEVIWAMPEIKRFFFIRDVPLLGLINVNQNALNFSFLD